MLKKWKWFIFFQSTNHCISSCLCVLCILRWYIFKPNSEKSENPSCWSMAVCVVCCIFTFCVSQLQDMNTCLVGSGLLQGSSTSWPIHSVSPKPLRPLRVVVSPAFREARGKFVLMECDPETPSINTFFFKVEHSEYKVFLACSKLKKITSGTNQNCMKACFIYVCEMLRSRWFYLLIRWHIFTKNKTYIHGKILSFCCVCVLKHIAPEVAIYLLLFRHIIAEINKVLCCVLKCDCSVCVIN